MLLHYFYGAESLCNKHLKGIFILLLPLVCMKVSSSKTEITGDHKVPVPMLCAFDLNSH